MAARVCFSLRITVYVVKTVTHYTRYLMLETRVYFMYENMLQLRFVLTVGNI